MEQMSREYEDSKDLDFIRRYALLKGMIKRTIMHLKLQNQEDHGSGTGGGGGGRVKKNPDATASSGIVV